RRLARPLTGRQRTVHRHPPGVALYQRPDKDVYYLRFRAIDGRGSEMSTGCSRKVDAIGAAHRIILEQHGQVAPAAERMPWEEARAKLKEAMLAGGKRPRTLKAYLETLQRPAEVFHLAKGPADISERIAADFKTKYA